MFNLKSAAIIATAIIGLGSAGAANANCALTAPGRTGTLLIGDYVWFSADGPKKAGNAYPYVKRNFREFTDAGWAGKAITVRPTGTRAQYVMPNGSHGWLEQGQNSTLPAGALGVGCFPVKK